MSNTFPVLGDGPTQWLSYSFRNVSQNMSMLAKDEAYDVIETSPQALKGWDALTVK